MPTGRVRSPRIQEDAADQLDERDDGGGDLRQGHPHVGEAADGAGDRVFEDLLRTVRGEDRTDDDAEDQESQRGGGRGGVGVRHEEFLPSWQDTRAPGAEQGRSLIPR